MKIIIRLTAIIFLLANTSCKTTRNTALVKDDGKLEIVFVQVNDVYEIAPIAGGKEGGMARVATLKKTYKDTNANTFLVMAGDFLSPSVYNSLKYQGERIRGAQMVDAMNAAGTDIAVFGNHEFDITEQELQSRINESAFQWVSSNTFHKVNDSIIPFAKTNVAGTVPIPDRLILSLKDGDGTTAKLGVIALTLSSNKAEHVSYNDPFVTAKSLYNQMKDSVDAIIAITHQTIADDIKLATELPGLAAILGGHEHSMIYNKTGNVPITKAHSNARSAYIVKVNINKNNHNNGVTTDLKYLDENVTLDSTTNVTVQKWKKIAEENYASIGFDPKAIVMQSGESLDGRETETRSTSTNFTKLITESMAFACPQADVVIFNSGSIRLDDILTPPISQYDIIRSLPFGGGIREAEMKGSLVDSVLKAGMRNNNSGGFLQFQPVAYNKTTNSFTIDGLPIDPNKTYRVAVTEFLFSGKEANLSFLNEKNPDVTKVFPAETATDNPKSDIRLAIIKYLESRK